MRRSSPRYRRGRDVNLLHSEAAMQLSRTPLVGGRDPDMHHGRQSAAEVADHRGRICVPSPEVMNTAVASPLISAVCQVPGSLIAYWPAFSVTVSLAPSACS
jgi:hypothetical protein